MENSMRPSFWPIRHERRHFAAQRQHQEVLSSLAAICLRLSNLETQMGPPGLLKQITDVSFASEVITEKIVSIESNLVQLTDVVKKLDQNIRGNAGIGDNSLSTEYSIELQKRIECMEILLFKTSLSDFEKVDERVRLSRAASIEQEPEKEFSPMKDYSRNGFEPDSELSPCENIAGANTQINDCWMEARKALVLEKISECDVLDMSSTDVDPHWLEWDPTVHAKMEMASATASENEPSRPSSANTCTPYVTEAVCCQAVGTRISSTIDELEYVADMNYFQCALDESDIRQLGTNMQLEQPSCGQLPAWAEFLIDLISSRKLSLSDADEAFLEKALMHLTEDERQDLETSFGVSIDWQTVQFARFALLQSELDDLIEYLRDSTSWSMSLECREAEDPFDLR